MKAFLVSVNGQKLCTAGIGTHGVLVTTLMWSGGRHGCADVELRLDVGGLDTRTEEDVRWNVPEMRVGDVVTLKVIESAAVDPEASRSSNAAYRTGLLSTAKDLLAKVGRYLARSPAEPTKPSGPGPRPVKSDEELPLAAGPRQMKAFTVSVNDRKHCTAGIGPEGVLSCDVCWVGNGPFRAPRGHLSLAVGGLDARTSEHLDWAVPALHVDDVVSVEVIETRVVDPEAERRAGPVPQPGLVAFLRGALHNLRDMLPEDQGRRVDAVTDLVRGLTSRRKRGEP